MVGWSDGRMVENREVDTVYREGERFSPPARRPRGSGGLAWRGGVPPRPHRPDARGFAARGGRRDDGLTGRQEIAPPFPKDQGGVSRRLVVSSSRRPQTAATGRQQDETALGQKVAPRSPKDHGGRKSVVFVPRSCCRRAVKKESDAQERGQRPQPARRNRAAPCKAARPTARGDGWPWRWRRPGSACKRSMEQMLASIASMHPASKTEGRTQ